MLRKCVSSSKPLFRILPLMLACLLWWSGNASAQTPPPPVATASQSFGFDYKDTDLAAFSVVRFEQQIDAGTFATVAIPPKANDALTPAGFSTYKTPIPALLTGNHSVVFRACSASVCGDPSTPFAFELAVKPPKTTNTRLLGS